jgi:DnaJ homolog subfamily C member 28
MTSHETESSPPEPHQRDGGSKLWGQPHRWVDIVEQQIAQARERGDFDNLRGQGMPLRLDGNPLAGEKALAYSLLKNNNMLPPEIERSREIVEDLDQAEALLVRLRRQRDRLRLRSKYLFASDRRSYNVLLEGTLARYREALEAINSKILSLNIIAPPALHQRMIDVEARLRAFHEEFLPL